MSRLTCDWLVKHSILGQAGRKSGNALGVLGLFFSAFESGITYFVEDYVPDGIATIMAGVANVSSVGEL